MIKLTKSREVQKIWALIHPSCKILLQQLIWIAENLIWKRLQCMQEMQNTIQSDLPRLLWELENRERPRWFFHQEKWSAQVKLTLLYSGIHRPKPVGPKKKIGPGPRIPDYTSRSISNPLRTILGAKSEQHSRLAARKYARVIQKLGFPAKFKDFKIQNMVGSVDVKFPIRLEKLVLSHSQFSSYEPELFPGLIYRMVKPRIVLLIFVSGKVVLTGAKHRKGL